MTRLPIALCLIFSLQGCATLPLAESEAQPNLTGAKSHWAIDSVWGKTAIDAAPITLSFDGTGAISGFSGCNRYTAKYSLDGRRLKISDIAATTNNLCDADVRAQEERFFEALDLTRWARPKDDGALLLRMRRGHGVPVRLTPATQPAPPHAMPRA